MILGEGRVFFLCSWEIGWKRDGCEAPVVDGMVVTPAAVCDGKLDGMGAFRNHHRSLMMVSPNGVVVTWWYC